MKKIASIIILAAVAALVTSCNRNASKLTKFIPKDASVVVGINVKNITEKLATGGMGLDTLASFFNNSSDSTDSKEKWDEIKSSGIDLGAEVYTFGKQSNSIMDGKSNTMGAVATLKDAAAFEQYLKKKRPTAEVKSAGDYTYLALGDDFVAGWKNNVVILAKVSGGKTAPGVYGTGEGTLSQQLLTKLFSQAESESVESVEAFKNVEKEQGDIFFYSNVSGGGSSISALSLSKVGDLIADTYATGTMNFEDGKVTAKLTAYTGKALGDILTKYPSHAIDATAIEKYPFAVDGFMALSFNPQVLLEIVKFAGAEDMATQMLSQYNLTMDDIVKAFKGDITAAMTLNKQMEKPAAGATDKSLPVKFVFNAAIGDKAAYDKVVKALNAKGVQLPNNGVVDVPKIGHMAVSITDKNIVVASDINVLQQYLSTGVAKSNLTDEIKDKIKGKSFAMYMNVDKAMQMKPKWDTAGSATGAALDTLTPTVKDFIATGDTYEGGSAKSSAELRLIDEKQNSLVTVVKDALEKKKSGKHFMFHGMHKIHYPLRDSTNAGPKL